MSDQHSQTRDELREVFIGRQPILDRSQALIGYELLFRATTENLAHPANAAAATAGQSMHQIARTRGVMAGPWPGPTAVPRGSARSPPPVRRPGWR